MGMQEIKDGGPGIGIGIRIRNFGGISRALNFLAEPFLLLS